MTGPSLSRRAVLAAAGAAGMTIAFPRFPSASPGGAVSHGLSVFGELKYPPDFTHFEYANPNAPKGGRYMSVAPSYAFNQNVQTFNTLNGFVLQGDAPPRIELLFDTLMSRALDEPDAVYGLLAESVSISEDGNVYVFTLRPEARFHDGSPVTADDVVFSFDILKEKGHPIIAQTIAEATAAEVVDERTVRIVFSGKQTRQLPMTVAGLPVFSKAYYEEREFGASTLEPPVGSGPYKVGRLNAGRFIEYHRDPDYWGRDLPVNTGHHNFDVVRMEFYRDRQIAFEAFKKGALNFREEFTSRTWATEYNFPAIQNGRVRQEVFPDDRPAGAQGWFVNTRRAKFADPRTRQALDYAFDFEWANRNLFFDLYKRTHSFFENSEMKSEGTPNDAEMALLEPFREDLPEDVFGEPYVPPVSNGSGQDRRLLREATRLLREAGWVRRGTGLVDTDGNPLEIEILSQSRQFERIAAPFVRNLELLGIPANFRLVDPAQYQSRVINFDFDLTTVRFALSSTPGEAMRQFWGSEAASTPGSRNLSGIDDPVVDALIEIMIRAESRAEMVTAARALDRVLRAGHYWIPQWFNDSHNVAFWDEFGWPEKKPRYGFPVESVWWHDEARAQVTARSG